MVPTPQNVVNLLPRQVVVPGSLALVALASLTHLTASMPTRETGSRPAHQLPYHLLTADRRIALNLPQEVSLRKALEQRRRY